MNHQMTESDMIIHILNNLSSEYESVIKSLETDLDDNILVDLEKVRAKLRAKYLRIQRYQGEKPLFRGERDIIVKDKTQFKGNCCLCGEYGHKANFCKKIEDKSKTVCNYCKKVGHLEKDCFRKARHDKNKGENTENERSLEVLMATKSKDNNSLTWIGDTGATSHMTNDNEGMFDIEPNNQRILIGIREKMQAVKKGKLKLKAKGENGEETTFILLNVLFVPGLWKKLFSISKVIKEGGKINSSEKHMIIEKRKGKIEIH
jgi:hypothetical protein